MNTLMTKKGFTLVEIMIVVAIIGLLAAIAIPNLLRARVSANDGGVMGDVRTFSTANESFRAAQNPPTYAPAITGVGSLVTPVAGPSYLDTSWAAAVNKHGHVMTYTVPAAPATTYSLTAGAQPSQGVIHYCIDQTGTLYQETTTAPAAGAGPAAGGGAAGCAGGAWAIVLR